MKIHTNKGKGIKVQISRNQKVEDSQYNLLYQTPPLNCSAVIEHLNATQRPRGRAIILLGAQYSTSNPSSDLSDYIYISELEANSLSFKIKNGNASIIINETTSAHVSTHSSIQEWISDLAQAQKESSKPLRLYLSKEVFNTWQGSLNAITSKEIKLSDEEETIVHIFNAGFETLSTIGFGRLAHILMRHRARHK